MIDVKIIKKQKNKATTPTLRTLGAAYGDKSVKEAVHASKADMAKMAEKATLADLARKADEAEQAKMADEVSLESKTLTHFLRNDIPNTAAEVVTFLKGIVAKAVSYFQGIINKGDINNTGDITNTGNISNDGDITNSGNIMTNNLTVTGKATFFELEIQKAKAAGGMSVNSAGSFHIDAVKETEDGFVCYQRAEKDGVTLLQTCEPKDQMMCSNGMNSLPIQGRGNQTNDGKPHAIGNHYYWRLATEAPKEVVMHTIEGKEEKCLKLVLSKTDRHKRKGESPQDIGDIPKVGDDLVQIGNRDNKERQSVIMTCAYNSFDGELKAPYWVQYDGVNTYELSKFKRTWFAANGSNVTGNFKVQSADGGLESIEDYVKGLAKENSKNTVVWHVAFSIRSITGKQGETFKLKYGRTVGENTTWYGDNPSYNGFDQLYVVIIDGATGNEQQAVLATDLKVADFFTGGSLTVRLMNNKTGEILAQDTIYPEAKQGKPGKDAVSYKLIPMQEAAVAYKAESGKSLVRLLLAYKIQKTVGEVTQELALGEEGIKLSVTGISEPFKSKYGAYLLDKKDVEYKETNIDTYIVTLKKGSDIVDQRIVPITFKPKVVFDIDTDNGKITSEIKTVKGQMSKIEQTAEHINLTVDGGIRPNLLWGSDLDLSEVQDKIQLAYAQGDVIKQRTAEKEELQRQLDATPTGDTAKRNDLQKRINACNDKITTAKNKVSECKAAIEKHLGVGLGQTKIDSTEYFQYLKGGGVHGSDAIMFESKKDVARIVGLCYGGARELRVKPHTVYTISAWLGFNSDGHQGSVFCDLHGWNESKGHYDYATEQLTYSEHQYDSQDIAKWTRCRWTFDTGKYSRIRLYMCCYTDNTQCEMYICRPKLEEGDTATPWCAYDGTVEGLKRTGIDIETGEITLDAEKTTVKGDLTARSLQTEGDPSKGGATIVAKGGMFTVYGVNKSVPGMEIGLNEAGEPVLKMYKNGKFMYDLGPDTIFEQVIERENAFTPCDMHRICNTAGNDMEKSFGGDFPSNYRKMVAYVFSEGYKRVGNQTRYKVSDTKEISTYNGVHFAEQRSVSVINENELESMSRIADGWYLNGGGPRVSYPSEPAYDGSNPQGYTCRRFGVRYYSNGKATSKLGSFTVCGNSQTGWTVEKIDIPFL